MPGMIVIIDNDPNVVMLLEWYFNRADYQTLIAENGVKGLGLVCRELPALIILDLELPDLDGLSVCKQLRANKQTGSIPIIILTAKSDEADRILGFEMGVDDYVIKPFSPRELVARVRAVLRRYDNGVQ
jgi:DNA-binding response OmpR family regulator